MRARKEHGNPFRKRNRSEVAYAMRVAVLLGKPSRRQRNPREGQRVLLSFPRKRSQGQSDRGLLLYQPPFASPGASLKGPRDHALWI